MFSEVNLFYTVVSK